MQLGLPTSCSADTYMEAWTLSLTAVTVRWHARFTGTDWIVLHPYSNSPVLPPLLSSPVYRLPYPLGALSERARTVRQSRLWTRSLVTQL